MIILNKGTRLRKPAVDTYVWDSKNIDYKRSISEEESKFYGHLDWRFDWKSGRVFKINKDADGRSYDRLANFTYKRTIND